MMAAEQQVETESTVRLHPKLSAVKQVMAVVLIMVSVALQLDPGMQRMAKVAVTQGADVLPGCTFGMIDTDRLSTLADGLFQAGLDGTAAVPITNNSSEGMYLEFGDEIGEVDLIDLDEVMQVGDDGAQAVIDTLTLEQQTAVEMHRAEVTFRQNLPRITEPAEIRKIFESWGGGRRTADARNGVEQDEVARGATHSRNGEDER